MIAYLFTVIGGVSSYSIQLEQSSDPSCNAVPGIVAVFVPTPGVSCPGSLTTPSCLADSSTPSIKTRGRCFNRDILQYDSFNGLIDSSRYANLTGSYASTSCGGQNKDRDLTGIRMSFDASTRSFDSGCINAGSWGSYRARCDVSGGWADWCDDSECTKDCWTARTDRCRRFATSSSLSLVCPPLPPATVNQAQSNNSDPGLTGAVIALAVTLGLVLIFAGKLGYDRWRAQKNQAEQQLELQKTATTA
jgi:hypothetical protein